MLKNSVFTALLIILCTLTTSGCFKSDVISQAQQADKAAGLAVPWVEDIKSIAEEGFIYGLPLVMNYAVMYEYAIDPKSGQFKAPLNVLSNEHRVFTWQDTSVISPNSDTPYSIIFMDLRTEPLVISVPPVDKSRYYSVMLTDANTFNYGYIGTRATGTAAGSYMVVGPNWKGEKPKGIKGIFRSSTEFSAGIFRTQLFNSEDMPNVIKVQNGYKVQTLSKFMGKPAPKAAPAIQWPAVNKDLVKTNFFEYLDLILRFAPAGPEEVAIRARLATIGIGAGKPFSLNNLSLEHKIAVGLGMKAGEEKVDAEILKLGKNINGWVVASSFGDRAFFNGDWLKRAAAAKAGIYGNDAVEAMYPILKATPDGEVLDASKHNYTLTFPKGSFPPVNAFWSVTMYDGKTELLIKNPINRYLINSPMLPSLKTNSDGSTTLYIQNASPGSDKEANWLPAPDGKFILIMRLYWPRVQPPSILPAGEGTWQPPGVVKASAG